MNNKKTLIAVTLAVVMSATAALAQTATPAAPALTATAPAASTTGQNDKKARHEEKFDAVKARKLEHLQKHAAEIQQKQSCVQAASDFKSLKECFPNKGWGKHEGKDEDNNRSEKQSAAPAK